MNETDTVDIDETNTTNPLFLTEAAGFMGAPATPDRLIGRVRCACAAGLGPST